MAAVSRHLVYGRWGGSQAHSKDSKTLSWMAGFLRGCLLTQLGQKAPSTLFPARTAHSLPINPIDTRVAMGAVPLASISPGTL